MKTTVVVTVALVLAALTAQAEPSTGIFVGEVSYVEPQFVQDPLIETASELQARIQAAQDQLSRYPDWYLLFGAPDEVAIGKLASELAEILIALHPHGGENQNNQTTLDFLQIRADAVGYRKVHAVGEALDVLSAMAGLVSSIRGRVEDGIRR